MSPRPATRRDTVGSSVRVGRGAGKTSHAPGTPASGLGTTPGAGPDELPGSAPGPARWHRLLEHASEIRLAVGAESFAGLAAEAGRALGELLLRGAPAQPRGPWRAIEVRSSDRAALLIDWLNEILYVAETGLWVPVEIEVTAASPTYLAARARGVPVAEAPAAVKAATLHGLRVEDVAGGLEAEVILDV